MEFSKSELKSIEDDVSDLMETYKSSGKYKSYLSKKNTSRKVKGESIKFNINILNLVGKFKPNRGWKPIGKFKSLIKFNKNGDDASLPFKEDDKPSRIKRNIKFISIGTILAIIIVGFILVPKLILKSDLKFVTSAEPYDIRFFDVYRDDSLIEVAFGEDLNILIGSNYYTEGLANIHKDNEGYVYFKLVDGVVYPGNYGEFLSCLMSKSPTKMNSKGNVVLYINDDLIDGLVSSVDGDKTYSNQDPSNIGESIKSKSSIRTTKATDGVLVEINNTAYKNYKEDSILYVDKSGKVSTDSSSKYLYSFNLNLESAQIFVSLDDDLSAIVSGIETFLNK